MNDKTDENFLIAERKRKLAALREQGIAYPNGFERDRLAASVHQQYAETGAEALQEAPVTVRMAGRMMSKRVMGKASFVHLQDGSGRMQLYVQRDRLPEGLYKAFKTWDVGDIIAVTGTLFRTRTDELTVGADELQLLTKSLRPLPEKWHGLSDQETRYRQRYVDLIVNEQSREVFKLRAAAVQYMREHLSAQEFMEVETPMMHPIPGGAVARPFVTHHNALDMQLYLRIAPELYLKRLVVGGFERVFEINRNFRNEGLSTRHNPEFTMLELYQAYAECDDIIALTETMIRSAAQALLPALQFEREGHGYDLSRPFARLPVEQAVADYNPQLDRTRLRELAYLREVAEGMGIKIKPSYGAGKLLMEIFEETVETRLLDPTFVIAYPTEVSPLSRRNDNDPFIADRFELFIGGREIANGFSELNDPQEQAERFADQVAAKEAGDDEAMFFDADYIRALEYGLPPTGGLGVGVDRLVMFFADVQTIRDVILFPQMRPEEGRAGGKSESDSD